METRYIPLYEEALENEISRQVVKGARALTQTYMAPLIYIYEDRKQLKWLMSRETL